MTTVTILFSLSIFSFCSQGSCNMIKQAPACICRQGYTGDKCESAVVVPVPVSPCKGFSCQHGGSCVVQSGQPRLLWVEH